MTRKLVFCSAILTSTLMLGGCYENGRQLANDPPEYSPNYTYLNVVSENGRTKRVLVPEACLTEDGFPDTGAPRRLPPGCANNYNLQRMAERKRDLTRGRPLAPAPAAPAARAAQNYIDGKREPVLGGGVNSYTPAVEATTTKEQVPAQ